MREQAEQLALKWMKEIESIGPIERKVESVNLFDIKGERPGQACFKVNFNFGLSSGSTPQYNGDSIWSGQLLSIFFGKFYQDGYNKPDKTFLDNGSNGGETVFNNDKADYMTYQGHRFIIQFYPLGFISEMREEKLKELGINK